MTSEITKKMYPEFINGGKNQKEDLRGRVKQALHGAGFDGIDTNAKGEYYQVCSDLLKIVEAYTVPELLAITRPIREKLSYCATCQRGFKSELLIKGFCPWHFNEWVTTLKNMNVEIEPSTDEVLN